MTVPPTTLLKVLLTERHLQNHRSFCREYDKQAVKIDTALVGTHPSRAQFYRWVSGELTGLPYPDHCRVLEAIFPDHSVTELFRSPMASGAIDHGSQQIGVGAIATIARAFREGLRPSDVESIWTGRELDNHWPGIKQERPSGALPHRVSELKEHELGRSDPRFTRFVTTAHTLRLSNQEILKIARLHGNIVEASLSVSLDIQPDGWASTSYDHQIVNLTSRPFSRLARETWFEHTNRPLEIQASTSVGHEVQIERVHNTTNMAKFVCNIDPPIAPGAHANIGYTCTGGRFISNHYWRQLYSRYTRWATIKVKHRDAGKITAVSVSEEHPDGFVTAADDYLLWEYDGADAVMTMVRDYLRPNQSITLRWERG